MESKAKGTFWGPNTLNNPTIDEEHLLKNPPDFVKECQGQMEVGTEGTPHFQFYVVCKSQQRLSALKKWLPRAHFQLSRNPAAVKNYCKKSDTKVEGTEFVATTNPAPHLSVRVLLETLHRVYYDTLELQTKVARLAEQYGESEKKAKVRCYWTAVRYILQYYEEFKNAAHLFARADVKELWFNTGDLWWKSTTVVDDPRGVSITHPEGSGKNIVETESIPELENADET